MTAAATAALAREALKHIAAALELCGGDSPVYQALEECRHALEDIAEGGAK